MAPTTSAITERDQSVAPVLLTDKQSAALLGIGSSTFHELRDAPWMPRPIQLGARVLRWSRAELEAAVREMPRQTQRSEPAQLARGKINRLKGAPA